MSRFDSTFILKKKILREDLILHRYKKKNCGVRDSNPKPCIYYALSLPTETRISLSQQTIYITLIFSNKYVTSLSD